MAGCNRETRGSNAGGLGFTRHAIGRYPDLRRHIVFWRTFSRRKLASLGVYLYTLASRRGLMLASLVFKEENPMTHVLAISAAIVAVMTILAFGEPTIQRSIGEGAQAQHSTKVRDQACYRRCRNDMRKSTSACNRMCR
jgi:hypothetical protein